MIWVHFFSPLLHLGLRGKPANQERVFRDAYADILKVHLVQHSDHALDSTL